MRVLITGDSHTSALQQGLRHFQMPANASIVVRPLGGGHLLPTPFFRDAGDHAAIIEPDYRTRLKRLPPAAENVDVVALSMPLWPMRVVHKVVWTKRFLAGEQDFPDRSPVSQAVYRQMVLTDQRYALQLIDVLQRNGMQVAAVAAPGLFRDHRMFAQLGSDLIVPIFETYLQIMKNELAARNVLQILVPRDMLDEDGFMLPRYRHPSPDDRHHANAEFGVRMIADLVAALVSTVPEQQ